MDMICLMHQFQVYECNESETGQRAAEPCLTSLTDLSIRCCCCPLGDFISSRGQTTQKAES